MTLHMIPEPAPLTTDDDGVIKVGGTRIPLATVVMAFHQGATAETMVQEYPSLTLADVYAAIGYYLRHQADVDTYLAEQQHEAAVVREQNEARFNPTGLRSRLLARRSTQQCGRMLRIAADENFNNDIAARCDKWYTKSSK